MFFSEDIFVSVSVVAFPVVSVLGFSVVDIKVILTVLKLHVDYS